MCEGSKQLNPETPTPSSGPEIETLPKDMNDSNGTAQMENKFSTLLELAANNDIEGFKKSICNASAIDETGIWYGRQRVSRQMVLEHRTPLMVAATYGSVDVVKLILTLSEADVNRSCGPDKSTALHCAVSGGSADVVDVVKLLLLAGADPSSTDVNGCRPFDVIAVSPKHHSLKFALEELLRNSESGLRSISPSLSSSPDNGSLTSVSDSTFYPVTSKPNDMNSTYTSEKKEYPIDPSLPDIKNSIYSTDEFRMFSFKVRPCSRAYSHDWTECPFVHPGENARRRDPRKYHYSCVPCPEFRKGACRRGDMCEYAHGVFECWLHPAQYRTRLCKDGTTCARRVCFFAHTQDELRPLYASTGSAVPSPRLATSAATAMDMAIALNFMPGSPNSNSVMSPSFTPPMSPSGNGTGWPQQNIPALHLPGSNLQTSRLRSSLSARDMMAEELNMLQQLQTLTPSNLEELFSAEVASSPRFSDQMAAASSVFSPSHKSAFLNQKLQLQQQGMLSPINTKGNMFSQTSFGLSSPGRMSPRSIIEPVSPVSYRVAALSKHQQQIRSLSSRDLGSNLPLDLGTGNIGSPRNSWFSNAKVDWSVQGEEKHNGLQNVDEPDVSWVQNLMKDTPPEMKQEPTGESHSGDGESGDHAVLGAWLEQMQLDQIVA